MNRAASVGVIGAYGGVGRSAVRRLRAAGIGPLRVGGRRLEMAELLVAEELGSEGEPVRVDVQCPQSLAAFCAGCSLVVSCAGPSHELLDTVARAAWCAGADVVETAGDVAVQKLGRPGQGSGRRTAVVSAGLMPGLSGLLPRCLAAGFDRPLRLTAYSGGVGRLTPASAADYLASLADGRASAAWQHGRRVSRALVSLRDVRLAPFPGRVTAHPFMSFELERTARALGLDEAAWYNVFDGVHLAGALARVQTLEAEAAAEQLVLASELDLFGKTPYQLMVFQLEGEAGGVSACQTLLLRAHDGIALTGAVTALAALAVLGGEVAPGVHYAAEALPPAAWWGRLRRLPEIQSLQVVEGPTTEAAVEEGEL
jgi:hypothetical protein